LKFSQVYNREKLYDAFGELIYAIAKADGHVQDVEISTLKKITDNYAGKYNIDFSFNYDMNSNKSVENAFSDAMQICKNHGPDPDYTILINIMVEVAKAYMGIVPSERSILERFVSELKLTFINHN